MKTLNHKFKSLIYIGLVVFLTVFAGATNAADPTPERLNREALEEIAPILTRIEIKKGDPFIEVFVEGFAALDCYDQHEYLLNKEEVRTVIIPRFKRSKPGTPCKYIMKSFREKAADLDPNSPASALVSILGHAGWRDEKPPASTALLR